MRNGFILLILLSFLALGVSSCGHSEGSSAIIGSGATTPTGGGSGSGTINGTVWKDFNQDKTINPGEPGIPDITVALFKDSNGTGALNSTDEQVATTTTDSNGNYSFTVTTTGRYFVRVDETQPAINGLALTTNNDEPTFPLTLRVDVTSLNTSIQNVNFGFFSPVKWSASIKETPSGTQGPRVTPTFISSPAIASDGTVYVGATDHFLYALNPDGTTKWKYETGNSLFASPAVGSDGTIYFGSEDRQIYAVNPDGTTKWIVPTKSVFTSSAAIAANGTIYVAGTDGDQTIIPCTSNSSCASLSSQSCSSTEPCPTGQICVAVQTGSLCSMPQDIPCGEGFSPCSTNQVCLSGHPAGFTLIAQLGNFYAVTDEGTKGKINWTVGLSGVVNSSPAIAPDGTIYIGADGDFVFDRSKICDLKSPFPPAENTPQCQTQVPNRPVNGHLYAIKPDGTLKWDFNTLGHVDSSPAIGADGTIYVGSEHTLKFYGKDQSTLLDESSRTTGFIYAINPNGTLKCLKDLLGDVDSSPAVGVDGTIYVGSDDFHVWALPPVAPGSEWKEKWVSPTRDHVKSSPAIAADGTIYIGSNDGSLYALNPDGTLKLRFASIGAVNSSPSIGGDGIVYFASSSANGDAVDSNTLYAIIRTGVLAQSPWPKFRHDLINTGRQQ